MLRTKGIWISFVIVLISAWGGFAWTQTKPPFYTLEVRVLQSFYPKKQPLQNIRVDLTNKNKEVICSGITDSLGAVFFDNHCLQNYLDTLIFKFYRGEEYLVWDDIEFINPFLKNGDNRSIDIVKEVQLIKGCSGFGHLNQPIYEPFETEKFTEFNLDRFKETLAFYPTLCIKFAQSKHPDESDELAAERMKNFELFLQQEGVDLTRLEFSYEFFVIRANIPNHDGKPRIDIIANGFHCE